MCYVGEDQGISYCTTPPARKVTRRPTFRASSVLLTTLMCLAGCGRDDAGATRSSPPVAGDRDAPTEEIFTDRARDAGLDFTQFNGRTGEYYLPEITGSGAALFDYDNDGDLDAYLVQGTFIDDGRASRDAVFPPSEPLPLRDRLFRNDLVTADGSRSLVRFTDVTEESGIRATGYGMGVATADYDNDGWVDLYVTNLRTNQLFRNNGDGPFSDVTAEAGVDDHRWSIAAVFFDYDRDGWLDLYCGNYVDFNLGTHQVCPTPLGGSEHCGPSSFRPEPDTLFRNRGDGTFEEITARAGLDREFGNGMGAIDADFNGDRWPDLYVANDGVANQMWINQRDGTFANEALLGGVAVNEDGDPEASMGVAAGDLDGDGDVDLFMTHLAGETNTVYRNDGEGFFEDASIETGLAAPSLAGTGFGTAWLDYDLDGHLDVLIANGAVTTLADQWRDGSPYPLGQANQLFRNDGRGGFVEVSAGATFRLLEVGRGVAIGDVDNDRDPNALLVNNSGPARLLINNVGQNQRWISFRALSATTGLDALGARVGLVRRVVMSLEASAADTLVVRVQWPGGDVEEFTEIAAARYNALEEGTGTRRCHDEAHRPDGSLRGRPRAAWLQPGATAPNGG